MVRDVFDYQVVNSKISFNCIVLRRSDSSGTGNIILALAVIVVVTIVVEQNSNTDSS